MQYRRFVAWTVLLLVIMLVMTGCAPRPGAGTTAAAAPADAVVVDLPALALDVSSDGAISMGGIGLGDLAGLFGVAPELASAIVIDPAQVDQITGLGIQHIQIENVPNGLGLYVNGTAMPGISWSGDQLNNLAALAGDQPALASLLPLIKQLGVGITLRFPVAEGVEAAPMMVPADQTGAAALAASEQEFVESVLQPGILEFPILYNADGSWTFLGNDKEFWTNTTGLPLWGMLDHSAKQMAFVEKAGIDSISLTSTSNGLQIVVNDTVLPTVDWSDGKLANVITFLQQAGMLEGLGDAATVQALIDQFLPMLTATPATIKAVYP